MIWTLEGAQTFMRRYADLLRKTAEESPEHAQDLNDLAEICESLAVRPVQTFHEALQSLWFLYTILHMESNASSFSPGRMDQYLWPYYEKDIREGRIDRQKALELIEALWLKFNQIVYLRNAHSAKYFAGFPIDSTSPSAAKMKTAMIFTMIFHCCFWMRSMILDCRSQICQSV